MQILWLKRDLRLSDHAPLQNALSQAPSAGRVLVCYFHEPSFLAAADTSAQHVGFVEETLAELKQGLRRHGSDLLVLCADALPALQALHEVTSSTKLWCHAETTASQGFARDQAVHSWARQAGVSVHELPQNAVARGTAREHPNRFSRYLEQAAATELWSLDTDPVGASLGLLPIHEVLRLRAALEQRLALRAEQSPYDFLKPHLEPGWQESGPAPALPALQDKPRRLKGGRSQATGHLDRFLAPENLLAYPKAISSPNTALKHCSRLSPYLAWGVLSDREVFHALSLRASAAGESDALQQERLLDAARFFTERLYWRMAYLQALENAPSCDRQAGLRAFDNLREEERMQGWLQAWAAGQTGFPFVDAAMRMLNACGWLNMRLRGTVASFALNDLWLPWPEVGRVLAREFLDYEPAIHWNQIQIHAGVSSHSGPLTYDVVKQAREHDPMGTFVREWVPELRQVPPEYIFEPWKMPATVQQRSKCVLGQDYPAPLVRHPAANDAARSRVAALREGSVPPASLYWKQRTQQLLQQGQSSLF